MFVDIAKDGTTLQGLMNSLMIAVSMGLQYGVPPEVYVSKLSHMRFEPSGLTNDADIRAAKSIVDYIFRWFGRKFLDVDQQEEAGILSAEVRAKLADQYANGGARPVAEAPAPGQTALFNPHEDAIECNRCGGAWFGPARATRAATAARRPAAARAERTRRRWRGPRERPSPSRHDVWRLDVSGSGKPIRRSLSRSSASVDKKSHFRHDAWREDLVPSRHVLWRDALGVLVRAPALARRRP